MKITKILAIVDTRRWEEGDDDKWYPIPGSGEAHECDRCGRLHEVHVTVECEDGSQMVVGTGCMGAENAEMASKAKSLINASHRLTRLEDDLAKLEAAISAWDLEWAKVLLLPHPPITFVPAQRQYESFDVKMGDATVWSNTDSEPRVVDERKDCVRECWRRNRMQERGFSRYRPTFIHDRHITVLRKEVKKLRELFNELEPNDFTETDRKYP